MGGKRLPHFGKHEPLIREFIRGGYQQKREMFLAALQNIDRLYDGLAAAKARVKTLEAAANAAKAVCNTSYTDYETEQVICPGKAGIALHEALHEALAALEGDPGV